jgi:Mce-associated membrane protein
VTRPDDATAPESGSSATPDADAEAATPSPTEPSRTEPPAVPDAVTAPSGTPDEGPRTGATREPTGAAAVDPESHPDAVADDEPVDDPADRRRRLGLFALVAALVVLLIGALLLGWRVRSAALDDSAREAALTAARQSAINLTSIDQEDFADDVARVLDGATGEFREDFAGRTGELERLLNENEVRAEGRVLEAGLVRSDRRSATALVVVDSTVRNSAVPDGRVNSYRMKLEVEKVGDQWLTSSLEFVG